MVERELSGICDWNTLSFPYPAELQECLRLRKLALRKLLPETLDDLFEKIWPYLGVSAVWLRSRCGSRYWWAGRYVVDTTLKPSEGAPVCRRGGLLLYRWRARVDTRPRGAGARSRACQTEAQEGEEEWRVAEDIFARHISAGHPHAAKLCVAGPLRSTAWMEITREFRETRDMVLSFE
eukprot:TRINITY_DN33379_c0_g1_i1.p2 TRINITY_DN33379_c0_g1~~TRINITY_DN33379_c0_g1_i1.p2  ORF type:complete len:179 (-),score=21.17 TRINITY_DN33379_c0_g1_i1:15-551(-)